MTEKKPGAFQMSFGARLRTYFFAGVLITAPVSLTIYLAWLFITFVDERVFSLLPPEYNPETYFRFSIPGIGLLLALVGLTLIGALTAGIIGRALNGLLEGILNRLPVIRSLYGAIKQIMETVLANKSAAFRECVLIEYPRKGMLDAGLHHRHHQGRSAGEDRGGSHQRVRADHAEPDLGLPAVRAGAGHHPAQDADRGWAEAGGLRRHRDAGGRGDGAAR